MGVGSFCSFESLDLDDRRPGWPQPARVPTMRERPSMTSSANERVPQHVSSANRSENFSPSASDSECEASGSSDGDSWHAAAGNALPPRSVTTRDLPGWRARMLLDSNLKSSPDQEETAPEKKPSISDASSARLMRQPDSLFDIIIFFFRKLLIRSQEVRESMPAIANFAQVARTIGILESNGISAIARTMRGVSSG
eukprot:TRINITY_DN13156_c0_g1_i1.p1 TRINITY_DN13156_c0_g1~~TRINITY_DN13156_c0_g1_i1.p1  ORF type:complete len:197 (-),score=33.53 TRINITY_DN13156_c0_g1_i1:398-988(-)